MSKPINAMVVPKKGAKFQSEEAFLDQLRPDEVLVKIAAVGVCHTDIACRDQNLPIEFPHVLGHEGAGVVADVGSRVTGLAVGDHVVLSMLPCMACPQCEKGKPSHCENAFANNLSGGRGDGTPTLLSDRHNRLNGNFFGQSSFADHAIANQRNAIKVSPEVPLDLLAPLGCGIQTGAGAVMNALDAQHGSSIIVFGAGAVGLSAIMAAGIRGCDIIIAVDLNDEKLAIARELGATHVINSNVTDETVNRVNRISAKGMDYALDCVGLPATTREAVDSLNANGVFGLVGQPKSGSEVRLDMFGIHFGKTLKGVLGCDGDSKTFIPELVEYYRRGEFPLDKLITRYPMEQIEQAIRDLESGKIIKPVLIPPA